MLHIVLYIIFQYNYDFSLRLLKFSTEFLKETWEKQQHLAEIKKKEI